MFASDAGTMAWELPLGFLDEDAMFSEIGCIWPYAKYKPILQTPNWCFGTVTDEENLVLPVPYNPRYEQRPRLSRHSDDSD